MTELVRLTLEYDGTGFHGWARQPGQRTVEGVLREALAGIVGSADGLAVAGRTDAGVHASGQVVTFQRVGGPPIERLARALNTELPGDVAVIAARSAPQGFHARFSALSRTYHYRVLTRRERSALTARRALWWPGSVELGALRAAAHCLRGEHDFRAFTPTETQHEVFRRDVRRAQWVEDGDTLIFEVTADSFLRHMVRTLVGTMLESGSDAPARINHLLTGRPRSDAGQTAPPWGLTLVDVEYPVDTADDGQKHAG